MQICYLNSNAKLKVLLELCLGPALSLTSQPSNRKMLHNHAITLLSMFWWQQQKKKVPLSFWFHCRCYALLPGTLLEVIQIRKPLLLKKKGMCKNVIVIMTCQRQLRYFNSQEKCQLLKLLSAPQYWVKLTIIFESDRNSNKQSDV